jgi:hypothetical protein
MGWSSVADNGELYISERRTQLTGAVRECVGDDMILNTVLMSLLSFVIDSLCHHTEIALVR